MPIVSASRADEVAAALSRGEVVAIPTDTVYGLAARPDDAAAVRRLAALKGRGEQQPIALLVDTAERLTPHLSDPAALDRVRGFWPGALTAVVAVHKGWADALTTAEGTIGVRQPDDVLALAVIAASGGALAVTSANRHGEPPALSASAAVETFGDRMLVLDGGPRDGGVASTVVDLTRDPPVILRAGPVTAEQLGLASGASAQAVSEADSIV